MGSTHGDVGFFVYFEKKGESIFLNIPDNLRPTYFFHLNFLPVLTQNIINIRSFNFSQNISLEIFLKRALITFKCPQKCVTNTSL